jgi:dolichyl-phosphate beta-glucosyltransferase
MRMSAQSPYISIVIPVYNEEQRIASFLEDVIAFLHAAAFEYELILVDDGSRDGTVQTIEAILSSALAGKYEIVSLPRNQGKGGALRRGMLHARGEYVFFLDADGSTSIRELEPFCAALKPGCDVYIAVRTKKHEAPFKRRFFGYGYIYLANALLGARVSDFTCGFKCYSRTAAQTIFMRQRLNNWSFDAEDLFLARKFGFAVQEIPVYWKHVGGSKVRVLKNVLVCGLDLLRIRWNDLRGKYA